MMTDKEFKEAYGVDYRFSAEILRQTVKHRQKGLLNYIDNKIIDAAFEGKQSSYIIAEIGHPESGPSFEFVETTLSSPKEVLSIVEKYKARGFKVNAVIHRQYGVDTYLITFSW